MPYNRDMGVIDLQAEREAREPHLRGAARCLQCEHEWEAVAPVGVVDGYKCPSCKTYRGVLKGMVGPNVDVFHCGCGCDLWMICADQTIVCPGCGNQRGWPDD